MRLEFAERYGSRKIVTLSPIALATVHSDPVEIQSLAGFGDGMSMVKLQVQGRDGRRAIAVVRATINSQGRVTFELSTNVGPNVTRREATAGWKEAD